MHALLAFPPVLDRPRLPAPIGPPRPRARARPFVAPSLICSLGTHQVFSSSRRRRENDRPFWNATRRIFARGLYCEERNGGGGGPGGYRSLPSRSRCCSLARSSSCTENVGQIQIRLVSLGIFYSTRCRQAGRQVGRRFVCFSFASLPQHRNTVESAVLPGSVQTNERANERRKERYDGERRAKRLLKITAPPAMAALEFLHLTRASCASPASSGEERRGEGRH